MRMTQVLVVPVPAVAHDLEVIHVLREVHDVLSGENVFNGRRRVLHIRLQVQKNQRSVGSACVRLETWKMSEIKHTRYILLGEGTWRSARR